MGFGGSSNVWAASRDQTRGRASRRRFTLLLANASPLHWHAPAVGLRVANPGGFFFPVSLGKNKKALPGAEPVGPSGGGGSRTGTSVPPRPYLAIRHTPATRLGRRQGQGVGSGVGPPGPPSTACASSPRRHVGAPGLVAPSGHADRRTGHQPGPCRARRLSGLAFARARRLPPAPTHGHAPLPHRPHHLRRSWPGPPRRSMGARLWQAGSRRTSGLASAADPGRRLGPPPLRRVRRGASGGLLLQGPRRLPFLQRPPHRARSPCT